MPLPVTAGDTATISPASRNTVISCLIRDLVTLSATANSCLVRDAHPSSPAFAAMTSSSFLCVGAFVTPELRSFLRGSHRDDNISALTLTLQGSVLAGTGPFHSRWARAPTLRAVCVSRKREHRPSPRCRCGFSTLATNADPSPLGDAIEDRAVPRLEQARDTSLPASGKLPALDAIDPPRSVEERFAWLVIANDALATLDAPPAHDAGRMQPRHGL